MNKKMDLFGSRLKEGMQENRKQISLNNKDIEGRVKFSDILIKKNIDMEKKKSTRLSYNSGCTCCPRHCANKSFCGKSSNVVRVAKVMRHMYEEPILCPAGMGSGAIFFSFCSLKCVYCQNYEISSLGQGKDIKIYDLCEIFKKLEKMGVANINLVTPTHYTFEIIEALNSYKPKIPVVWNSSGYEDSSNINKLKGLVDIFLFDAKYFSPELSAKYSGARDYFDNFIKSLVAAREIVGEDIVQNGVMKKGIIVRLLVLPNAWRDSIEIFRHIKEKVGTNIYVSLMSQYVPMHKAKFYPEINRKITPLEYKKVLREMIGLGFNKGFTQDKTSANTCFTPDFSHSTIELK